MHSTGRPSSVHETGLLGFANEYYREMPPTSSTLQTLIANVLSGGGTGSRTTAIQNYIDGDYVRQAYADEEMDENKIGCYKLLVASNQAESSTTDLMAGATINSGASELNVPHLWPVNSKLQFNISRNIAEYIYEVSEGLFVPGEWVLIDGQTTMLTTFLNEGNNVTPLNVALWHRYA